MNSTEQEEYDRYRNALERIVNQITGSALSRSIAQEALAPPEPVMGEVVRWWCPECQWITLQEHTADCPQCSKNTPYIKLTGTYLKPKKRMVKHREEIEFSCSTDNFSYMSDRKERLMIPKAAKLYAEWQTEE